MVGASSEDVQNSEKEWEKELGYHYDSVLPKNWSRVNQANGNEHYLSIHCH